MDSRIYRSIGCSTAALTAVASSVALPSRWERVSNSAASFWITSTDSSRKGKEHVVGATHDVVYVWWVEMIQPIVLGKPFIAVLWILLVVQLDPALSARANRSFSLHRQCCSRTLTH